MSRQPFSLLPAACPAAGASGQQGIEDLDTDPFAALVKAFATRVAEVKRLFLIRVEDSAQEVYAGNLQALEAHISGLESKLQEIRTFVDNEKAAIPKAAALIEASARLKNQLRFVENNLPPYLPTLAGTPWGPKHKQGPQATAKEEQSKRIAIARAAKEHEESEDPPPTAIADDHHHPARKTGRVTPPSPLAPRKYVSHPEFKSVSAYMRGRLTVEKVNASIDEIAAHSESNARLIASVRQQSKKLSVADRKHALDLLHGICKHEDVKGKLWFVESDLKNGNHLKLDKTGKNILTLLRHLGRIHEVRVSSDGGSTVVYTMD